MCRSGSEIFMAGGCVSLLKIGWWEGDSNTGLIRACCAASILWKLAATCLQTEMKTWVTFHQIGVSVGTVEEGGAVPGVRVDGFW